MKVVKIDFNKCTGCQTCEVICSLSHTGNIINPEKSRIRVFRDEEHGLFFPVMAGPYTETECVNKSILVDATSVMLPAHQELCLKIP